MEKVLILTYYWPPSGGPGVQRWLKFVKYLPALGYQPIVVTVDPNQATYPLWDNTLVAEIPAQAQVFTTPTREPYALYKKITGKKQVPYSGFVNENDEGFRTRISRFIRGNLFVPDARIGWNGFAVRKATELIREHNIRILITTSPPHSTQLAGLRLKERFPHLRWVADLRDPWTDIFYYDKMLHLPFVRKKDMKMEKQVLQKADGIITVSNFIQKIFRQKLDPSLQLKVQVIPNGFDGDDFIDVPPGKDSRRFTLAYIGTLADSYDLSGFIEAAKLLKAELGDVFHLRFTGHISHKWKTQLQQHLTTAVEFTSHVTHREAICHMQQSSMLLLVIPDLPQNEGIITGKLFEYLAAGKPVLGIGPPAGDAAEILQKTACGEMLAWDDTSAIYNFVLQHAHQQKKWEPDINAVLSFSRYQQTQKLVEIMQLE